MTRRPAVAGMFYEADKAALEHEIERCFLTKLGPGKHPHVREGREGRLLGLVCPHAGYVYSGSAAAHGYSALAADGLPDIAVFLGPNHYGMGAPVAVSAASKWQTPLGTMQVDTETASAIARLSQYAEPDDLPHSREHSIEVQLPFLQYIGGEDVRIVPIAIAHLSYENALLVVDDIGSAIARALAGKSAVVIASTDFTHQESAASALAKDSAAIEEMLRLDGKGLLRVVEERSITMCGAVGTAVMIEACKALGATRASKLTYYNSGDVTGDTDRVVGYGALSVIK